jgi:hypothetical protein
MYLVDQPPNGTFTTPELARLAVYRAAVKAGFYTDWDGSASSTDTQALAWLGGSEYPFTADERERLDRLRVELTEGRYADDQPAPRVPPVRPSEEQPAAEEPPGSDATPEGPAR